MSNKFALDLLDRTKERFSIDSLSMSYTDWVCKNTTMKNRPFSLSGYEFQRQILDDMHPNLDVIKISQVGITEIEIRKALAFLVRNAGVSCIYSLPNEDMFTRISNARVKPIVDKDKVFNTPYDKANRATRSMDIKQFGQSFLYMVAAIESAATSIDADMVLNDEVDISDQASIALFNSRLQGSKYRISQRFSTPSFPAFGVDLNWQTSDQHHYMMKCGCCGNRCHPEFTKDFIHLPGVPESMDLADVPQELQDDLDFANCYVKCNKCHKPLDLGNPEFREWVAKYPSRVNSRGYRINPFVTDSLDIPYIYTSMWRFTKLENRRGFFNTVLGLPYTDGSIQIPEDKIRACMTTNINMPDLSSFENIFVGIDVGQTCHFTLGDERGNIICVYQKHVDELVTHVEYLCKNYKIRAGAIDRHPYEPTADEVFQVSGGKIVPTEYRGTKDVHIVEDAYGNATHAQVNRTWVLDQFASRIKKTEITISGYSYHKEIFIEHLRNMVRDETPEKPAEWKKLNPSDHYFHSSALMNASFSISEHVKLKSKLDVRSVVLDQIVPTRDGTSNIIGVSNKKVDRIGFKL